LAALAQVMLYLEMLKFSKFSFLQKRKRKLWKKKKIILKYSDFILFFKIESSKSINYLVEMHAEVPLY
jgi:hypothetical protein